MRRLIMALMAVILSSCVYGGYFQNIEEYLKNYKKQYFIYVNKDLKRLYLIDKHLKVWKIYIVATGAKSGDKVYRGDKKTPSGVYKILDICQYQEPWYMDQIRESLLKNEKNKAKYNYYWDYYRNAKIKNIKAKKKIASMNSVYFEAAAGHTKYGTGEDLGYNVYGSAFMLLDYPNKEDWRKYSAAKEAGRVPHKKDGSYTGPGSGIAIHGTNDDPSIGNDASSGCVRMQNADIVEVSNYVSEGTMVVID